MLYITYKFLKTFHSQLLPVENKRNPKYQYRRDPSWKNDQYQHLQNYSSNYFLTGLLPINLFNPGRN